MRDRDRFAWKRDRIYNKILPKKKEIIVRKVKESMNTNTITGIMIPFLGTAAGAAGVFFLKGRHSSSGAETFAWICLRRHGGGFCLVTADTGNGHVRTHGQSGISSGRLPGFLLGIFFLFLMDHLVPHLHLDQKEPEGPKKSLARSTMLILAVTMHNIPEGMAVGVVYAGVLAGNQDVSAAGAIALSAGIAIQNFPEGAIISMPLLGTGMKKGKAFLYGMLSGIVEPAGAFLMILFASALTPFLPYFLSFAAGAMIYVVVEELIPESSQGKHSNAGTHRVRRRVCDHDDFRCGAWIKS